MKLFVANGTHHIQAFVYRVPEQKAMRTINIGIGAQTMLPDDLDPIGIDYVLNQHLKYGLVPVSDVVSVKGFKGMCYSIDKPVPSVKIQLLMDHNQGFLVEEGKRIRQEAAVVGNEAIERVVEDYGRPEILKNLEIEIVEDDPRDGETAIAEGIRLTREGDNQSGPNVGANRASRRRGLR